MIDLYSPYNCFHKIKISILMEDQFSFSGYAFVVIFKIILNSSLGKFYSKQYIDDNLILILYTVYCQHTGIYSSKNSY